MWYFNIINLTEDSKARFNFSATDTHNLSTNHKKIHVHMKLAGSEIKVLLKGILKILCLQENIKEKEKRNNLRAV